MKHLIFFLASLLIFSASFAQDSALPSQYQSIKEVLGDLDKDGIDEKVVVYNIREPKGFDDEVDREIVIFKKEKESWKIWHRSTKAIGNTRSGGMMGDSFGGLEIVKGVLIIYHEGGSSWKWNHYDKYRYQNNSFELIGYSSHYGKLCEYWESFDFNVKTGKIIVKKEYEKCEGEDEDQVITKRENETFVHKLKEKITLQNRSEVEIEITSPKYKHDLHL